MIKSINDIYREKIIFMKKRNILVPYLSKLNIKEFEYISGIMISDLYKMFFYLKNSRSTSLKNLEDNIDYYRNTLRFDKEIIEFSADATYNFYDMDLINKSILMDELNKKGKDNLLMDTNKLHFLDKGIYSFAYDLSYFVDIYIDFMKKYRLDIRFVSEFIADKLEDLKIINYEKYTNFILEFLRSYYKYNIYKQNNAYLDMIKNSSLGELYKISSANYKLLCVLIENYLKYSVVDKEIKRSIDDYFNDNADAGIQKKLKFKEKKDF